MNIEFTEHNGCWLSNTGINHYGYSVLTVGGKKQMAHRVVYQAQNGDIPEGLNIDHTCHNGTGCDKGKKCLHRRCINPDHLEAVTPRENIHRGQAPQLFHRPTHCPSGHEYTPENTRLYQHPQYERPWRFCRECKRQWDRNNRKNRK